MEGGNLIVELIAALVETPARTAGDFLGNLRGDRRGISRGLRHTRREFQHVQRPAAVAIRRLPHQLQRPFRGDQTFFPQPSFLVFERRAQHRRQVFSRERSQHIHARS